MDVNFIVFWFKSHRGIGWDHLRKAPIIPREKTKQRNPIRRPSRHSHQICHAEAASRQAPTKSLRKSAPTNMENGLTTCSKLPVLGWAGRHLQCLKTPKKLKEREVMGTVDLVPSFKNVLNTLYIYYIYINIYTFIYIYISYIYHIYILHIYIYIYIYYTYIYIFIFTYIYIFYIYVIFIIHEWLIPSSKNRHVPSKERGRCHPWKHQTLRRLHGSHNALARRGGGTMAIKMGMTWWLIYWFYLCLPMFNSHAVEMFVGKYL